MITLDLDYYDAETEIDVTASKSGLSKSDAKRIVSIIRALRESDVPDVRPTIRASIMIARASKFKDLRPDASNTDFHQICMDILCSETMRYGPSRGDGRIKNVVDGLIKEHCPKLPVHRLNKKEMLQEAAGASA